MDWSQTSEIQAIIVVVDATSYAANVKEASDSSSIIPAMLVGLKPCTQVVLSAKC